MYLYRVFTWQKWYLKYTHFLCQNSSYFRYIHPFKIFYIYIYIYIFERYYTQSYSRLCRESVYIFQHRAAISWLYFSTLRNHIPLSAFTKRPTLSDAVACPFNGQLHAAAQNLNLPPKPRFHPIRSPFEPPRADLIPHSCQQTILETSLLWHRLKSRPLQVRRENTE